MAESNYARIAEGTLIIFTGTAVGLLFAFLSRVLIARYFTEAEYGIFSLGFVILNIFMIVSLFGLQDGSTRQIAFYRGNGDDLKVKGVVFSSIQIVFFTSTVLAIILFISSDIVSVKFFNEPRLTETLGILSLSLPFFSMIYLMVAIFRGFESVKEKIYFQQVMIYLLFLCFLGFIILLDLSFVYVIYAFTFSIILTFIAFAVYVLRKKGRFTGYSGKNLLSLNPVGVPLFLFSAPLMFVLLFSNIIVWTDTLLLGYFTTSDVVGLYNGTFPLANIISIPLTSLLFIFVPVVSNLYSRGSVDDLRRDYVVLNKWLFYSSFPLFMLFFLFPELVLNFFFGNEYTAASDVLRILSIGYIINNLTGPNGASLIAMGETRFLMFATVFSFFVNLILNIILINSMGMLGAAIASTLTLAGLNAARSLKLYSISRLQPLSVNLIKPSVVFSIIACLGYHLYGGLVTLDLIMFPFILISSYLLYFLTVTGTKSLDNEDLHMLTEIERQTRIKATFAKRIIQRLL